MPPHQLEIVFWKDRALNSFNEDVNALNMNFLDAVSDGTIYDDGNINHGLQLSAILT